MLEASTGKDRPVRQLLPSYDAQPDLLALYGDEGPYVRAGFVLSVDGAAVVDGGSRALSTRADRAVFRTLRAVCDVILVGAGTTRAEDYGTIRLLDDGRDWRAARGLPPLPRVAVVSRSLEIDERVYDGPRPLVVTCRSADTARLGDRADVVVAGDDEVDLRGALDQLAALGLGRVLCEGGPSLFADLLAGGLVDELCLTTSPLLVGATASLLPTELAPPRHVRVRHLLEEDGTLLARYDLGPA